MGFIHFEESMRIIDEVEEKKLGVMKRFVSDAQGYVLAEDIVADHDSPSAPTSAMDGYAIVSEDQKSGRLKISGINPAGDEKRWRVERGEAVKTFTGSLMPEGSDTLIPIENVTVEDGYIVIDEEVPRGYSVREAGENYARGEKLIEAGTIIDYPQIGVMAGLNMVEVSVHVKPRVAVLATGSELLALGEEAKHEGQIRSTNDYTIAALVRKYGGEAIRIGCVGDDRESIAEAFRRALSMADIVVTTRGVSVGDFDFVKDVITQSDATLLFKGVRIKPGQHIACAKLGEKFIVGLPGFAYSSTVTALLYVVPLMARLTGRPSPIETIGAVLREDFRKKSKKAEFTACNLRLEDGVFYVDFDGKKSGTSAILTNMLGDTALLYTTEDEGDKKAGEMVKVVRL